MTDVNRLLLAVAVAGGYVLGRTKKGRLALAVASYAAGRQFGVEPRKIVTEGAKRLGEIPQVADLGDQLRGELMAVGREAVSAAADRRLAAFADALHERTLRLEGSGEEEDRGGPNGKDLDQNDEEEGHEKEHAHEDRARGPRARGTPEKKPGDRAGRGNGTRRTGDRKRAAGGTTPSKKPSPRRQTAERAAPGKKTPSSEKAPSRAGRRR
ncbi:histone protein [Streptomyces sp. NPDC014872]|uniref:histone protein n=1 Tax=Streptomyces sp. NPDC014872 TaxID=3364926 RepID=UPI0036F5801D